MVNDRVVFVRGAGRCGSKNLAAYLGQHPDLALVPVNQVLPEELIDWSRERLQASDARITDEAVAAACRAYFLAYARALAGPKGIILQKSTRHAHHLSTLLEFFPEARIVYLVRHPFGWVEAMINATLQDARERGQHAPDYGYVAGVVDSVLQWHAELSEYVRSAAFGHDRLMQVHFEELISNPQGTADRVCDFLGLRRAALPAFGEAEVYERPFVLNERERAWIGQVTRGLVAMLGYDPDAPPRSGSAVEQGASDLYPECRMRGAPPTADAVELTQLALQEARRRGFGRVALFGAGYFGRRVCGRLSAVGVHVVGVVDENPALVGGKVGPFTVYAADDADKLGIQAVIPLTFVHQERLALRWKRLTGGRIPLVPLWQAEEAAVSALA